MTSSKANRSNSQNLQTQLIENKLAGQVWKDAMQFVDAPVYQPGLELFRQDSRAEFVYFSEAGLIKLMRSEDNGRELILSLQFSGTLLGVAAAINGRPHPFSAVTVTSCKLARMAAHEFLELVAGTPRLASALHELLSAEILDQTARISQIACLPARYRLEQLLWQLATDRSIKNSRPDLKFQLPLRYWEVAQLLAITPTYLSRLFTEMEREGVISRSKGWIGIELPEKLWHSVDT